MVSLHKRGFQHSQSYKSIPFPSALLSLFFFLTLVHERDLPLLLSLIQLMYCAVLVYSYNSSAFLDGSQMGDLLADYIDNGGGVVATVFTNCNNLRNGFVKGRFLDGGYHPITPSRQHDTNGKRPLTLGRIYDSNHPIMQQVRTIDGGKSSFFCPGTFPYPPLTSSPFC